MIGPCAKRRVVCTLYPINSGPVSGTNDCYNPQAVCPRLPGEGYLKCNTICKQPGHAEDMALMAAAEAGVDLQGARAYITGHYYMCESCGRALREAGVTEVILEMAK